MYHIAAQSSKKMFENDVYKLSNVKRIKGKFICLWQFKIWMLLKTSRQLKFVLQIQCGSAHQGAQ